MHVATVTMGFGAGKASERQHVKVFSEQMSWRRVRSRPPGHITELRGCGRTVSEMAGPRDLSKARESREVRMDASSVNPPS